MTSLYCERKLKQLFFYCPLTVSAQSRRIHVVKTMVSGPRLKARQQGQVSRALSDYHYKDEVPCQQVWHANESSLLNGHECRVQINVCITVTGNGDVSVCMKNSSKGRLIDRLIEFNAASAMFVPFNGGEWVEKPQSNKQTNKSLSLHEFQNFYNDHQ